MKHWLDKIIEEQKCNTDILNRVASPYSPAELTEMHDRGELEDE